MTPDTVSSRFRRIRHAAGALLVSALLVFQPAAAQTRQPQSQMIANLLDWYGKARGEIAERRSHLDTALLTVEGALAKAGSDANAVTDFVSAEVAYSPYLGSLLGASGVVAARQGNALDQSVLLAAMLNRIGYEARIVSARLDETQTDRLIDIWFSQASPDVLPYRVGTASAQSVARFVIDPDELASEQQESQRLAAARERARIYARQAAAAAGVDLTPKEDIAGLRRIVGDYHWVQFRDAPFSDWEDAHPAFGRAGYPSESTLEPTAYFTGSLPDTLVHRVTLRGYIDRVVGGQVSRHAITSEWSTPVANLEGRPISFGILPLEAADAEYDTANVFVPSINGQRAPGAMMFDRNGGVVDMSLLDMGAPGSMVDLILTMSDKGADAAGQLAGLDFGGAEDSAQPQLPGELLRVILTIKLDGPGGSKTHERVFFDRVGPDGSVADWETFSLTAELFRHLAFVVDAGFDAPARWMERLLARLDADMQLNELDLKNGHRAGSLDYAMQRAELAGPDPASPGLIFQAFNLLGSPEIMLSRETERAVPNSPSVISIAVSPLSRADDDKARTAVDIVSLDWSIWRRDREEGRVFRDPSVMADFGAAVTLAEEEFLRAALSRLSTAPIEQTSAWSLLDDANLPLQRLNASDIAAVASDLKRGRRVVSASPGDDAVMTAWWSVDPNTGLVLGMTRDGGAASAEAIMVRVSVGMSIGFMGLGMKGCYDTYSSDNVRECCLYGTVVTSTVMGGAAGGMLGRVFTANYWSAAIGAIDVAVHVTAAGMIEFVANTVTALVPSDLGLCGRIAGHN